MTDDHSDKQQPEQHHAHHPHLLSLHPPHAHAHDHHHHHVAHHIHEFGEVPDLQHLDSQHSGIEDEPPVPATRKDKVARRERFRKLGQRLFHERHLMQYFGNNTLFRTQGSRNVRSDELFLDLVIVGGLAALGHELRENFSGWDDVEKFILLFHALYSSWRADVFLWNLWDVKGDVIDKIGIYLSFIFLTGVALGAHGAFDDGIRPYVSVSAFLATAVPSLCNFYWSIREPLLQNEQNIINPIALPFLGTTISVLPYLAAAFVPSERAARILFWIPIGAQVITLYVTNTLYRYMHRNRPNCTRLAVSIEHIVEKFEVLTMIVLGESVLGLLFEAALFVTQDGAQIGQLYAGAIGATLMLYCFQTLYVNVDNSIAKGDVHAIRHKALRGLGWNNLHMLYHFSLVLFATGLGISIRDVVLPPKSASAAETASEVVRAVVRAGSEGGSTTAKAAAEFTRNARWLFSVGWGASVILSAAMSAMHFGGPRAATKKYRLALRVLIAIGLMVGMPFSGLSAGRFIAVFATVLFLITSIEFILVHTDRMGFFRSEYSLFSSSGGDVEAGVRFSDGDDDSSEMDETEDTEKARAPEQVEEFAAEQTPCDSLKKALTARMQKKHCNRLVAVREKKKKEGDAANEETGNTTGRLMKSISHV